MVNGLPVYLVQDIETSYYREYPMVQNRVLNSYRSEFRYVTTSSWTQQQLRELGLDAELISPGIDLDRFRPLPGHRAATPCCSPSDDQIPSRTCR